MSTIIKPVFFHCRLCVRLLRGAGVLISLVFGWIGVMALATVIFGSVGNATLAFAPAMAEKLPKGSGILRATTHSVVVAGSSPALVRGLYGAGAWLVLPSLRNGCMELRKN